MADLIDRQMAIEAVMFGSLSSSTVYGKSEQGMAAQKETVQAIRMLPSAERHGHWVLCEDQSKDDVDNGNYLYVCSNCNYSDVHAKTVDVPYCWHCGAKMDEVT